MNTRPRGGVRLGAVAVASGAAGLGYEMAWVRMFAAPLGHEVVAVLAVLAAFFVGLALGAFLLGGALAATTRPGRWYVALELTIAAWAVTLALALPALRDLLPQAVGGEPAPVEHMARAFAATFVLLLPATLAMGATLPALERIASAGAAPGQRLGRIYAANTFGAVLGTLATTFLLAPSLGYTRTLLVLATVNGLCAVLIGGSANSRARVSVTRVPFREQGRPPVVTGFALLVTGLLGLAVEVLAVRVLAQVLEDTVYTFACVLAVYLVGTALGAAVWQSMRGRTGRTSWPDTLLVLASLAALATTGMLYASETVYSTVTSALGVGRLSALCGDMTVAALVLGPFAAMSGALFTALVRYGAQRGLVLGHGVALSTLGSATAPFLAGVLLLPAAGALTALTVVALGYLVLLSPRRLPLGLGAAPALGATAMLLLAPPLLFVTLPAGGTLLAYQDGVMASVAVVADQQGVRHLKVDNHFTMGSTSSGFADHRQTHLPLLLHPAPKRALLLGVGTGMSMGATRNHADLSVTAVELVPEVLETLPLFGTQPDQNWPRPPRLIASDARRHVLTATEPQDVIIADLFHPSREGAGLLYTREHFTAVRARLAPGGLFCQWLPLFQMDIDTFRLIARSFSAAFPAVQVVLPHFSTAQPIVGLIGSEAPIAHEPGYLERRVTQLPLQQELVRLRLNSDLALLGGFLGDRAALNAWLGDGPINTDDRPLVTFVAPDFAYRDAEAEEHGSRLLAIVDGLAAKRTLPLAPDADPAFAQRLAGYLAARDRYVATGVGIDPTASPAALLARTGEGLLGAISLSSDFLPAYLPLLAMADALAQSDRDKGLAWLRAMNDAAPGRGEARALLARYEAAELRGGQPKDSLGGEPKP